MQLPSKQSIKDFVTNHGKFIATLVVMVGGFIGVPVYLKNSAPGDGNSLVINIDPNLLKVEGVEPIQGIGPIQADVQAGEMIYFKLGLKAAIAILQVTAPRTKTDLDDRLLVLLKDLDDLTNFLAAEQAVAINKAKKVK